MFRKRRLLALALSGALALALAACSGAGSPTKSSSSGGIPSSVKIGFIGSLTGPLAASGINSLAGLKAGATYAETLHKGMHIQIISRDTAGVTTSAVAQTRELAQDGVSAIFFTTEAFPAVQSVLNQVKIPGSTSGGIAAVLDQVGDSKQYKYAFSTGAGTAGDTAVTPLLDYAIASGATTIGNIDDGSAYAVAQADLTEKIVAADYPKIKLVRMSYSATSSDATAQLSQLKAAGAQAVVEWPYGAAAVTLMSSFDKLGWYPRMAGTNGLGTPAIIAVTPKGFDGHLAAGPIPKTFLEKGADLTGATAQFIKGYLPAVGKTDFNALDAVGANAFDWSVLVAQGAADRGTTSGAAIKDYLVSGKKFVGANGVYTFGPDKRIGIGAKSLELYQPLEPCTPNGFCVPAK